MLLLPCIWYVYLPIYWLAALFDCFAFFDIVLPEAGNGVATLVSFIWLLTSWFDHVHFTFVGSWLFWSAVLVCYNVPIGTWHYDAASNWCLNCDQAKKVAAARCLHFLLRVYLLVHILLFGFWSCAAFVFFIFKVYFLSQVQNNSSRCVGAHVTEEAMSLSRANELSKPCLVHSMCSSICSFYLSMLQTNTVQCPSFCFCFSVENQSIWLPCYL